ncbi:MAG: glutamine-hydrolyzing carbamoyl-phosphate synthase small subunit [bacterium]
MKSGYLILKDGTIMEGKILGYEKETTGEVVFTTGMTGYPETLTDPSYCGQILTFTYPLIGNYGISQEKFESDKIQVAGIITSESCQHPSHCDSEISFSDWCAENKITILTDIDTRLLTEKLRNHGTIPGGIFFNKKDTVEFKDINEENLVARVSGRNVEIYVGDSFHDTVLLYDCGVKMSIIRSFVKRGVRVIRVPWDYDYRQTKFSGVVISNGPGDPEKVQPLIEKVRELIKSNVPLLGICLGNQILALALGAKTYKLKFGHRSQNQPVMDSETQRCYITSQNHGFAVQPETLPNNVKNWFKNLNDGTCEGIYHLKSPLLGVQFHPEANPGPTDTDWIFDLFLEYIKKYAKS